MTSTAAADASAARPAARDRAGSSASGREVGVDDDGGGALVLAELGQDAMRGGDGQAERAQRGFDAVLVLGVGEGEEQRDGDGFGVAAANAVRRARSALRSVGQRRDSPSALTRSGTPKRRSVGHKADGHGRTSRRGCGRVWRPMAMVSSKPAVVTKATRAPLRSSMALVPTVVPWRTSSGCALADARARLEHGRARVGRRGEDLEDAEVAVLEVDAIGEGAAGVDGYAQWISARE